MSHFALISSCFLVAEHSIDLSDKTITMGDTYLRLVKCLYQKFTIRKNIKFDFSQVLKSTGKLALATLTSCDRFLKRSEVLKVVGDFAFEYGLFTGYEDFRLMGDINADIYVTYGHRSLEEFFGSFGFIDALSGGKSVDEILGSDCEEPIFMVNPLVLSFCLWFLSSQDFEFSQRDVCYNKLTSYTANCIDSTVFDPKETRSRYSAINMFSSDTRNHLKTAFFRDVLGKCPSITTLHLKTKLIENTDRLLALASENVEKIKKIIIGKDRFKLKDISDSSLLVSIDAHYDDALQTLNLLLQKYYLSQRNPQIYLRIRTLSEKCDINHLLSRHSKELHIKKDSYNPACVLIASGELPYCQILTHLTLQYIHIEESFLSALRYATKNEKLPCLERISLKDCCGESSRLDHWPKELNVSVTNREGNSVCNPEWHKTPLKR